MFMNIILIDLPPRLSALFSRRLLFPSSSCKEGARRGNDSKEAEVLDLLVHVVVATGSKITAGS